MNFGNTTPTGRRAAIAAVLLAAALAASAYAFSASHPDKEPETTDVPMEIVLSDAFAPVNVTLLLDGETKEYAFFPVTCADFLRMAGVELTKVDSINVSADTRLFDHMLIDVTTVGTKERTEEYAEPCEYDYIDVDTIPMGTTQVITEGTDSVERVTYRDTYRGGKLVSTEVISREIVSEGQRGTAYRGVGGYVTSRSGMTYHYSYMKIMEATAYTYIPGQTTMTCASGATLCKGCVAVDPRVIPMHTKMFITSDSVEYGYGSAEDTGGLIKGNIVDLAYMSVDECFQFGRRNMRVYFLD